MRTAKNQAEALRICLNAGFVTPEEVVAWADNVIQLGEVPSLELIELSLGLGRPLDSTLDTLAAMPGVACKAEVARAVLCKMAQVFERNPATGPGIARVLYQMYLDGTVTSVEAAAQMSRLDDAFDLAEAGHWGTTDEVTAELGEFLSEWTSNRA